ncbi:MAG: outer membrane beta-barrel protein [Thiolinea sp.]
MKIHSFAAAACLGMLASSAFAGGASPFYLGATIGQSNVDLNSGQMDNQGVCTKAGTRGFDCRIGDGDNAGHIYGGFQISESIAVEAGYANLGNTASYHYTDPATITQDTHWRHSWPVFTVSDSAKRHPCWPTARSAFRWTSEAKSNSDNPSIYHGSVKDSGVAPLIGAGVEYEMTHNVSLRAGWDRYYNVGDGKHLIEFNETGTDSTLNTLILMSMSIRPVSIFHSIDVLISPTRFNPPA